MAHFFGAKIAPRWPQDGTKMEPRWHLGGLLGALGAILAQFGPKSQHNPKNQRSRTPPLGPKLAPNLGHFGLMLDNVGEKRVPKHSWKTCCLKIAFFNENGSPRAPPRTPKNQQKNSKIQGFRLFNISGSWQGSRGTFWRDFGPQVAAKLAKLKPSWSQVG